MLSDIWQSSFILKLSKFQVLVFYIFGLLPNIFLRLFIQKITKKYLCCFSHQINPHYTIYYHPIVGRLPAGVAVSPVQQLSTSSRAKEPNHTNNPPPSPLHLVPACISVVGHRLTVLEKIRVSNRIKRENIPKRRSHPLSQSLLVLLFICLSRVSASVELLCFLLQLP